MNKDIFFVRLRNLYKSGMRMAVPFLFALAVMPFGDFPVSAYLYVVTTYAIIMGLIAFFTSMPKIRIYDGYFHKRNALGVASATVNLNNLADFSVWRWSTFSRQGNIFIIMMTLEDRDGNKASFPIRKGYSGEKGYWDNDGELQNILNEVIKKNQLEYDEFAQKILL